MYNILEFVKDLNIPIDETRRLDCPVCKSYKTFTATNNMGSLVWNCYKISCSLSGSTRIRLSVDDIKSVSTKKELATTDTFQMPEYVVPHNNRNGLMSFCDRWQLDADKLNLHYDVKDDRVVFPIEHKGKLVDATGRVGRAKFFKEFVENSEIIFSGTSFISELEQSISELSPKEFSDIFPK